MFLGGVNLMYCILFFEQVSNLAFCREERVEKFQFIVLDSALLRSNSNYFLLKSMKIILGLAGEMASGKGTVAEYMAVKYNAKSWRFSTMLRDVLDRLSLEQSRDNMQNLSTILRQSFGEELLARVMAEDVKKAVDEVIIIDGVRRLADIKYLREIPQFKLAYLEADMQKRYERITKRGENSDDAKKTFEDFKKAHADESELQIRDLKNRADFLIDNNGSYEDLYGQVDEILGNNFELRNAVLPPPLDKGED